LLRLNAPEFQENARAHSFQLPSPHEPASFQRVNARQRFVAASATSRGVKVMRGSQFSKFDRELIYYRARPARRTAVSLSILFLLGLAALAALTTARPADSAPSQQTGSSLRQ
jgi:hypothetical protein